MVVGRVSGLKSRMASLVIPAARRSFDVSKPIPVAAPGLC